VYNILDVFGDFGGVKEVISMILIFFLSPVADHVFLGKAISKLYMAKTNGLNHFQPKKNQKFINKRKKMKEIAQTLPKEEKDRL
jgi:hypothetical protein